MSILVHLIAPDGTRHERPFPDGYPDAKIVSDMLNPKGAFAFGRVGFVVKKDQYSGKDVPHADPNSPWIVDHPETRIVVGEEGPGGTFRELRQIHGPNPTPAEEAK